MYPNLYYAFKDLFGIEIEKLRYVNSFGFFVAIAFILAAIVLSAELRRKSKMGVLQPTEMQIMVGRPATFSELALNFLLGFLFGYKILALFIMSRAATEDPQAFIFSSLGSWPAGIAMGLLFAGFKWYEKNKQKLSRPEKRTVRIWPQDRVGEITILALVFGLLGAKLFDIFENWGRFVKRPADFILSPAGLTFYGGLICAALAIWLYARKHKIAFWHLNDAAATALMLAYAVGRIGCQVAGDGDWGIYNSAFTVNLDNKIVSAAPGDLERTIDVNKTYFVETHGSVENVPSASFKIAGLPEWMLAYDYPRNVNEAGVALRGCDERKFCTHLPAPVFPTPFYETVICLILFGILWAVRKKLKVPGTLFALYLMMNGIERFLIEKIRVNTTINLFGFHPTQAELISTLLFLSGLFLWVFLSRKSRTPEGTAA